MDTTLARSPIGQLLDGRYRVESHIARGGMADVYLGTDTRLERTVALKIMRAELANDEEFVRRFIGEARSVARLSHPNVVGVYDQGSDGRTLFLAMEYVPGPTLRSLLHEQGRLNPREALDIMDGVLSGLSAAHAAGLAHRDVKPENVLLSQQGLVKVADFGLARLLTSARYTKTGTIIGTAAYLAPEQVARGEADARTDVYAAGVMLFELLTGSQPHLGETPLAVAYKHVNEVVPAPSSAAPGLPPALDALVAMATSRDPDLRPGDAGQFLQAMNGVRHSLPPVPPPPLPPPPQVADLTRGGDADTPAHGVVVPPGDWPGERPLSAAEEIIPGLGPPPAARQTFGAPDEPPLPVPVSDFHQEPAPYQQGGLPFQQGEQPFQQAGQPYQQDNQTFQHAGQPFRQGEQPFRQDNQTFQQAGQQPPPYLQGNQTLVVSGAPGDPYGPPDGPYRPHREWGLGRWLFSRRLGIIAAGVVAAVLVGMLVWWQAAGRYTRVPRVGGLTLTAARSDLRGAGFTVKLGTRQLSNSVAKGDVIRTSPGVGARVGKGSQITLILSAGPHMIPVPQVTGQQLANAEAALKHAGLTIGKVTKEPSINLPAGIVISTDPSAGTSWPQPKPVGLMVSAGPPVPNFVGQQKAVAEQWTQQNGVNLNEVTDSKSAQPAGTITHQSPAPGGAFTQGELITVKVSAGPQMVAIPNVDGMQVNHAVHALEKLGFHVNVIQAGPLHVVFNYTPNGQAPQGSTITVFAGLPSAGGN